MNEICIIVIVIAKMALIVGVEMEYCRIYFFALLKSFIT